LLHNSQLNIQVKVGCVIQINHRRPP